MQNKAQHHKTIHKKHLPKASTILNFKYKSNSTNEVLPLFVGLKAGG